MPPPLTNSAPPNRRSARKEPPTLGEIVGNPGGGGVEIIMIAIYDLCSVNLQRMGKKRYVGFVEFWRKKGPGLEEIFMRNLLGGAKTCVSSLLSAIFCLRTPSGSA
jgi:hypothetical protein